MGRMPVLLRPKSFNPQGCPQESVWGITRRFHRLSPGWGLVAYALRTRAPLSLPRRGDPVRLACIRPAASVHPEPGSNSSLYIVVLILFSVVPGGFTCSSLFGILGSLPFRLLFIGSLLSKNLQPPSLSIADAKVHQFFIHATLFAKFF